MSEELVKRLGEQADFLRGCAMTETASLMLEAADALSRPAPVAAVQGEAVFELGFGWLTSKPFPKGTKFYAAPASQPVAQVPEGYAAMPAGLPTQHDRLYLHHSPPYFWTVVQVNKRGSKSEPQGIMVGHVVTPSNFYDGCAVEKWGGTWYGPLAELAAAPAPATVAAEALAEIANTPLSEPVAQEFTATCVKCGGEGYALSTEPHRCNGYCSSPCEVGDGNLEMGECDACCGFGLGPTLLKSSEPVAQGGGVDVAEVAALNCPNAAGFEGPETFPDCGKCVVCRARALLSAPACDTKTEMVPRWIAQGAIDAVEQFRNDLADAHARIAELEVTEKAGRDIEAAHDMDYGNAMVTVSRGDDVDYRAVAQFLYGLLDDIDTAGDVAKSDDGIYRKIVEKTQAMKNEAVAECDGYTVTFKTPAIASQSEGKV